MPAQKRNNLSRLPSTPTLTSRKKNHPPMSTPIPMNGRPSDSAGPNGSLSPLAKSPPHQTTTIEYASSAPFAASSSKHAQDGTCDEAIPDHLYSKLPAHYLVQGAGGKVPDYLRMILTSKVYSAPLNLQETPLTYAANLSKRLGCEIYLKREDLHPVFSFKIRGAYNMMASLTEEDKKKGVITCSAGNHAQGVALSGGALGIAATIVMPVSTPSIKVNNVRRLGGKAVLFGQDFDAAKAECLRRAEEEGLTFIPPYDDPYVIAGQGTIAMEICRQITDPTKIDGIFAAIGGGGLTAGISTYMKRVVGPNSKVYGVETVDGDAMFRSLKAGHRVVLDEVGPFADGTAVRLVGEECYRVCKENLDGIPLVSNDEICAAIKDVYEETRSVPEPSGALALAGLKAHIQQNDLKNSGKTFVAVVSGGNMNFSRLRFVTERAEIGEGREVLMSFRVPEKPGSFIKLHKYLLPRAVTEFSYRYSDSKGGFIICSFTLKASSSKASGPTPEERAKEVAEIIADLKKLDIESMDLSDNEFAKSHVRHLVGGRSSIEHERVFRFEFPERPGALDRFLTNLHPGWNISLFHYRNHGADVGRVLVGLQPPPNGVADDEELNDFLNELGYPYVEETDNVAYRNFLCA